MPRPIRIDAPGAVHHVTARGNERRPVFFDDADRRVFLRRLDEAHSRLGFVLHAYCLMTNHVHLAVRTGLQPLSRVALALFSAYAADFNRRHSRVGHLFQGRYKASRIVDDRHLLAVVRYIHRNPVDAGIVCRSNDFHWSSDRFYRRGRAPRWMDCSLVTRLLSPDAREGVRRYAKLMDTPTTSERERALEPADPVPAVGGGGPAPASPDRPDPPVARYAQAVARSFGEPLERLRSPSRERSLSRARALTAILASELGGIPLCRTAWYFGRDESTIARAALALQARRAEDPELRRLLVQLRDQLCSL